MPLQNPLHEMRFRERGLQSTLGATYGLVRDGQKKNHQGWDLVATPGTPCLAVADGKIVEVGYHHEYGRYVNLLFKGTRKGIYRENTAFYAHLNAYTVKKGDEVKSGQIIGYTGATGNAAANAPHLHIEFHSVVDRAIIGKGLYGREDPGEFLGYHHYQTAGTTSEPGVYYRTPISTSQPDSMAVTPPPVLNPRP